MKPTQPKPTTVLESSQYRDPLAVYEASRRLTREDLERAKVALLDAGKSQAKEPNAGPLQDLIDVLEMVHAAVQERDRE